MQEQIEQEMQRQEWKWGPQCHLTNLDWLSILAEEFGEIAQEVTKLDVPPKCLDPYERKLRIENLLTEMIQTSAVIQQWYKCLEQQ
jgi:NTP pyrophosphatase (non-canonical NTP hydrolase)